MGRATSIASGRAEPKAVRGQIWGCSVISLLLFRCPPPPPPSKDFLCFTPSPPPLVGERSAGGAAEFASRRDWSVLGDIFAV